MLHPARSKFSAWNVNGIGQGDQGLDIGRDRVSVEQIRIPIGCDSCIFSSREPGQLNHALQGDWERHGAIVRCRSGDGAVLFGMKPRRRPSHCRASLDESM